MLAEPHPPAATATLACHLRRALLDLYEPWALARSPLVALLRLQMEPDPPAALRRLLLQAIEALRPPDNTPPQANAWRTYRILLHRYVQQVAQAEMAASLGFSVRQLQRHERAALQALADYVWARHSLDLPGSTAPEGRSGGAAARLGAADQELAHLRSSFAREAVGLAEVAAAALRTVAPLLQAAGVALPGALPPGLPPLAAQAIPLRQALVSLLQVAARLAPGGRLELGATVQGTQLRLRLEAARGAATPAQPGHEEEDNLALARDLLALSGGALEVGAGSPFVAVLLLPVAQQLAMLFIDDNADALQLCQRYLEGTPFAFVGAREPAPALELARELAPKAIVLDVMLPGMDGWEVLGHLREHPATRGIPIIVSTILPHERLALTLGAAAFLRKPFSRESLLGALEGVTAQNRPTPAQAIRPDR